MGIIIPCQFNRAATSTNVVAGSGSGFTGRHLSVSWNPSDFPECLIVSNWYGYITAHLWWGTELRLAQTCSITQNYFDFDLIHSPATCLKVQTNSNTTVWVSMETQYTTTIRNKLNLCPTLNRPPEINCCLPSQTVFIVHHYTWRSSCTIVHATGIPHNSM